MDSDTGQVDAVALSLDVACFAIAGGELLLLLMQREQEPFAGWWALPGGIVRAGERLDAAAARLLEERTGVRDAYLEQLYTFADPERDPRGRTVSVAYYAVLPLGEHPVQAGRGARTVAWHPARALPLLAFDHDRIAAYARWRLEQKVAYAPLAFRVLPPTFTMATLRAVHEAILGHSLHPSNFVRQMQARWDLAPVSGSRDYRTRRPARLYRYIGPPEIPGPPAPAVTGADAEPGPA